MTETLQLNYASASAGTCPLCQTRPVWKKTIYGHPVCKKCFYKFANRRQLAYLADAILWIIIVIPLSMGMAVLLAEIADSTLQMEVLTTVFGLLLGMVFIMKDGFNGHSFGKWLCNVQVLSDDTDEPIGFGQSFKRNAILLLAYIPFIGGIVSIVVVVGIAITLGKGKRWGDNFARTRVIWKKYANNPVFAGQANNCTSCGYNLQGNVSGICPECGTPIASAAVPATVAV